MKDSLAELSQLADIDFLYIYYRNKTEDVNQSSVLSFSSSTVHFF